MIDSTPGNVAELGPACNCYSSVLLRETRLWGDCGSVTLTAHAPLKVLCGEKQQSLCSRLHHEILPGSELVKTWRGV